MELDQQLEGIIADLSLIKVETSLMLGSILLLVIGLIKSTVWINKLVFGTVLIIALILNQSLPTDVFGLTESIFISSYNKVFTGLFLIVGLLILVFDRKAKHSLEIYFLMLSMVIGAIFMMKSNNLLILYLAIELVSFSSYLLTGFSFKKQGFEASLKYLLFGAGSSAITLFGVGLIYGTTGGFYISDWTFSVFEPLASQVGLIFLLLGLLFKASIVPMHIWAPAVYQSAPNDAVALMSVVPKLAAFVVMERLIAIIGFSLDSFYIQLLLFFGVATILIGTFSAINQSNVRRMIAFGSIAHSGFLLVLIVLNTAAASDAFWIYATIYSIMNIAIFYLIQQYENNAIFNWRDYRIDGSYVIPVAITIILISLVGIPPVAGFTAKIFLFSVLYDAYLTSNGSILLVYLLVSVFATVVSLFYYLRIPYQLFLVKSNNSISIKFSITAKIIATLFAVLLLLMFFVPKLITESKYLLNP